MTCFLQKCETHGKNSWNILIGIKIVSQVFILQMSYRQLFAISVVLSFASWISVYGRGHIFPRPAAARSEPGALRPSAAPGPARRGWAWLRRCSLPRSPTAPPICLQGVSGLNASRCSPSLTGQGLAPCSLSHRPAVAPSEHERAERPVPRPRHQSEEGAAVGVSGRQRKSEAETKKGSATGERFLRRVPREREVEELREGRERRAKPRIGRILPQTCGEGRGKGAAARNPGRGSQVPLFLLTKTQRCHRTVSSAQGKGAGQESSKGTLSARHRAGTAYCGPTLMQLVRTRC